MTDTSGHVVENRIRIWSDGEVVELFDNWDGMGIMTLRIGAADGHGEIAWSCDEIGLDWGVVRILAKQLNKLADEHDAKAVLLGATSHQHGGKGA